MIMASLLPVRGRWRILAAPGRAGSAPARAANDNAPASVGDALLRDALEHFAATGLGAAVAAIEAASLAHAAGDVAGFDHWLAVAGLLDPRRAAAARARFVANGTTGPSPEGER